MLCQWPALITSRPSLPTMWSTTAITIYWREKITLVTKKNSKKRLYLRSNQFIRCFLTSILVAAQPKPSIDSFLKNGWPKWGFHELKNGRQFLAKCFHQGFLHSKIKSFRNSSIISGRNMNSRISTPFPWFLAVETVVLAFLTETHNLKCIYFKS